MKGAWRWLALLVVALLAVAGVQRFAGSAPDAVIASASAAPAWGPATYQEALSALDRDVARERYRVEADPASWMRLQSLAIVLHARATLTGSHDDHAEALAVADRARELSPDASGPVLARAVSALSLHRIDIAREEVLRFEQFAVPPPPTDRAEAQAVLGDVALYSGRYTEARERYEAALQLEDGLGTAVRLADWHRHMGNFADARDILTRALENGGANPWTRATLLLQLGAIDLQAGLWEKAEAQFAEADQAFPGWWLARAHLGQMAAVRGDFSTAEALYREALIGPDRPSVMDALAAVLVEMGREDEAAAITRQASALWLARVETHPAAYADHAFEAVLAEGDDARAARLALLNYRTRPYGDGRIGLARAAALRGMNAQARGVLEELEGTGWRSTEQYAVLAEVCGALGDRECLGDAEAKALAISPLAFDPRADLLFFSNH